MGLLDAIGSGLASAGGAAAQMGMDQFKSLVEEERAMRLDEMKRSRDEQARVARRDDVMAGAQELASKRGPGEKPTTDDMVSAEVSRGYTSATELKKLEDNKEERRLERERRADDSRATQQHRADSLEETRRYHDILAGGRSARTDTAGQKLNHQEWTDATKSIVANLTTTDEMSGKAAPDYAARMVATNQMQALRGAKGVSAEGAANVVGSIVQSEAVKAAAAAKGDQAKYQKFLSAGVAERMKATLSSLPNAVVANGKFVGIADDDADAAAMMKAATGKANNVADEDQPKGLINSPVVEKPKAKPAEAKPESKPAAQKAAEPKADTSVSDAMAKERKSLESQLNALENTDTSKMNSDGKATIEKKIRELKLRIKNVS